MSNNETKLGVAPNLGGLLCNVPCCIGFIFSIVAVVVEKENKFVRFHAFQSLLLHGVGFVVFFALQVASIVVSMVAGPFGALIGLLGMPIGVALLGAQIFMMVKANGNEELKLPVIGDMATKWV
jgi:uncharacterized membrane protein